MQFCLIGNGRGFFFFNLFSLFSSLLTICFPLFLFSLRILVHHAALSRSILNREEGVKEILKGKKKDKGGKKGGSGVKKGGEEAGEGEGDEDEGEDNSACDDSASSSNLSSSGAHPSSISTPSFSSSSSTATNPPTFSSSPSDLGEGGGGGGWDVPQWRGDTYVAELMGKMEGKEVWVQEQEEEWRKLRNNHPPAVYCRVVGGGMEDYVYVYLTPDEVLPVPLFWWQLLPLSVNFDF